ncbi:hypothetical protein DFH08DRAFT_1075681 [Mycena albidolilacea]|uniref:Uncharacterized protein n=1 Tax=Mycena albidolilacea TaxID=1033008 RepID=A0AAD7EYN7_9AGAR|nr:hypothetical protein DFH08DRAFT_1075681 [Mycena albidolilacea]
MLLRLLVISAKFSVPDDKTVLASRIVRENATALVTLYPGGSLIARAGSAAGFCWPDSNTPAPNAATSTPPRLLASSAGSPSSRNRAPGPGLSPPSPLPVSPLSTISFAPPPPTPSKSTPSAVRQRSALARGGSDDDEDDGQEMEVDS